jgi:hypothetical protein
MPNWCNNTFKVSASKEQIDEFQKFLDDKNGKDWFDFFLPCPQELKDVGDVSAHKEPDETLVEKYGHSDWYSWSVENWGCKWNCDAQDWTRDDDETISFWFDSPWGPPTALYQFISQSDWSMEAQYHEEGMCFVGEFIDGEDWYYEYSDLESLDDIPDHIVENWNIREMLEEQEEWNEEEDDSNETTEDLEQALDELKKEFDEMVKEKDDDKRN